MLAMLLRVGPELCDPASVPQLDCDDWHPSQPMHLAKDVKALAPGVVLHRHDALSQTPRYKQRKFSLSFPVSLRLT